MRADSGIPGARAILGLYDGCRPSPALAASCHSLGLDLLPHVEGLPASPDRRLLIGPATGWRLGRGLTDHHGFLEFPADGDGDTVPATWRDCLDALAMGGIAVSLSSVAAYAHDVPRVFAAALARRFPSAQCLAPAEMALYEALSNAVIHGNLGVDSAQRHSAAGLHDYRRALAQALRDPVRSTRRVAVSCIPIGSGLRLAVRDQGDGWDMSASPAQEGPSPAKSGRGLALIHRLAVSVHTTDQGRCLTMDFAADAQTPD